MSGIEVKTDACEKDENGGGDRRLKEGMVASHDCLKSVETPAYRRPFLFVR